MSKKLLNLFYDILMAGLSCMTTEKEKRLDGIAYIKILLENPQLIMNSLENLKNH